MTTEAKTPTVIHLFRGEFRDLTYNTVPLCGAEGVVACDLIPLRHWNGKSEGVCEECLKAHAAQSAR